MIIMGAPLMAKGHSNVCYIHRLGTGFEAVKKAKAVSNSLGLDLFEYNGFIYEGRSGVRLANETNMPVIEQKIESTGGISRIKANIEAEIAKNGESPRYARPNECRRDVFPPAPRKENTGPCRPKVSGRADEAAKHSAAILEAQKAEREKAITAAENCFIYDKEVENARLPGGRMLIIELLKEHEIPVPPKMQEWIGSSLTAVFYDDAKGCWRCRCNGSLDTAFFYHLKQLQLAVLTKQQYNEMIGCAGSYDCPADNEDDIEFDGEMEM